jgi:NAD(P)-dependent dehydrogenase (short-subunit alcohol dehydrogenase family)
MKGSSNGRFAYATSKTGLIHLTRMMQQYSLRPRSWLFVNSIAPGIFPSEKTAGESNEQQKPELDMEMSNPVGRFGHDTDMGTCILFLAGPGGVFLNS